MVAGEERKTLWFAVGKVDILRLNLTTKRKDETLRNTAEALVRLSALLCY